MISVYVIRPKGRKFFSAQWVDPVTGLQKTRTTKKAVRRDAERVAAVIQKDLNEGTFKHPSRVTWEEFRDRYETEVLPGLSAGTWDKVSAVFNTVERLINPGKLSAMDTEQVSRYVKLMRGESCEETTVKSHLGHLKAAFNWAKRQKMMAEVPQFEMPARTNKATRRAPTGEEFERMIEVIPDVVDPSQIDATEFLLRGLWLGGLRIGEAVEFSWDDPTKIRVNLDGRHPLIEIPPDQQKNGLETLLPMAPEFYEHLMTVPVEDRTGKVFKLNAVRYKSPRPLNYHAVKTMVGDIGKAAKVSEKSYASAHDLRRGFGVRWSKRVMPAVLRLMMRHSSVQTTMAYYAIESALETADTIWQAVPNTLPSAQQKQPELRVLAESATVELQRA